MKEGMSSAEKMVLESAVILEEHTDRIQVAIMDVSIFQNPDVFAQFYQRVPLERKKKIEQCRQKKDKILSLGAGALLIFALEKRGLADAAFNVKYGENGKPYFVDQPGLFYNLSHSGERVMCVLSDTEVGCDIEEIHPSADQKIARRFYTDYEYQMILQENSLQKQMEKFFQLWTLKESFLKVTGDGMKMALDSFEIRCEDKIRVYRRGMEEKYTFYEYHCEGYKAAVCKA